MSQNFYLLHGLPGAGKTLTAMELQKSIKNSVILSTTELRKRLSPFTALSYKEREDLLVDMTVIMLKKLFESGASIILDDSFYTLNGASRGVWCDLVSNWTSSIILVSVTHPEAKYRSSLRGIEWEEVALKYQAPSFAERRCFEIMEVSGGEVESSIAFEKSLQKLVA